MDDQQKWPMAIWMGQNREAIELFLRNFELRYSQIGEELTIRGPHELKLVLTPGDWIMYDDEKLGVLRAEPGDWQAPRMN